MTTQINVVGFDPALNNFGIARAVIDLDDRPTISRIEYIKLVQTDNEAGKVVRKNSDDLRRAQALYGGMLLACTGCAVAIAEIPTGTQSARGAMSNGIALGVLSGCPLPLIEVQASEVKLAAVGHKYAAKEEMIEWAMAKYPDAQWLMRTLKGKRVPIKDNEHMADAIAVIEAGIQTAQFKQATALFRSMSAMKAAV